MNVSFPQELTGTIADRDRAPLGLFRLPAQRLDTGPTRRSPWRKAPVTVSWSS
ncbi:MAG TPA: hypothetical protein VFY87_31990 [Geminicoccaceae bacterium]|nr:hypothetical protein [Geminicoccaceae bacterium]